MTQSTSAVQGGRRKRTDLIPTMPIHGDRSPRSPLYASSSGASSSRGSVSRSTGMSVSLSRLDQLSQPRRRLSSNANPNPSSPLQPLHETESPTTATTKPARASRPSSRTHANSTRPSPTAARSMSKSMSHLASPNKTVAPVVQSSDGTPQHRTTRAERLRQKARQASQRPHGGFMAHCRFVTREFFRQLLQQLFQRSFQRFFTRKTKIMNPKFFLCITAGHGSTHIRPSSLDRHLLLLCFCLCNGVLFFFPSLVIYFLFRQPSRPPAFSPPQSIGLARLADPKKSRIIALGPIFSIGNWAKTLWLKEMSTFQMDH